MPLNLNLPAPGTPLKSAEIRDNLTALNAKIDALPAGPPGPAGPQGDPGPQGPPFADAVVDGVSTLSPSDPATVSVSFDGTSVHFSFGIPQGAPGDVTAQQLTDAIADTPHNPSGIGPYGGSFSDPPTAGEMNDFAAWAESLRAALVR